MELHGRVNLLKWLNSLIDAKGENGAVIAAIPQIIAGLLDEMRIVRMASGAESNEFLSLSDALAFYKSLRNIYKEDDDVEQGTNTGRMFRVRKPTIGGCSNNVYAFATPKRARCQDQVQCLARAVVCLSDEGQRIRRNDPESGRSADNSQGSRQAIA